MLEYLKFWLAKEFAELTTVIVVMGIIVLGFCLIVSYFYLTGKYAKWRRKSRV